jgi:ribonuclease HI
MIDSSFAWGFFDGACQGTPGKCGAGVVLHFSSLHFFSLKYGAALEQTTELNFLPCGC